MGSKLVIVESPAKAKTIEKILGKDYIVKSSYGHVRDLSKKSDAVKVEENFEPVYEVTADKKNVVKELKTLSKKMEEVILATDEDREGEAISWHLCHVLGLNPETSKRIVFREITKPAIKKAIESPRNVDINLVNAQQARRILDRLVGYELSETLWKKVKGKLSAGRVQSVAVKLIVDKEREIAAFQNKEFFNIHAVFDIDAQGRRAELKAALSQKVDTEEQASTILEDLKTSTYKISDIKVKPSKKRPAPPFTTSTLQQEASRRYGFAVRRTMIAAQRLYEQGLITYMRTDSTNLSGLAVNAAKEVISDKFGERYSKPRQFSTKSSSAQEAHEAIRPTNLSQSMVSSSDRDVVRLYDLIWKRTLASQMADAEIEKTTAVIVPSSRQDMTFQAEGEVVKFDGFLKLYMVSSDEDAEQDDSKNMLPPLSVGQVLDLDHMSALQRFSKPPARYSEAGLVKKLEELGIGRPSTYAPTISRIMEESRGYVYKDSRDGSPKSHVLLTLKNGQVSKGEKVENVGAVKNRLFPTDIGMVVSDFLAMHFEDIMNYKFTADCEEKFDDIAEGKMEWKKMLGDFYHPFHKDVRKTIDEADRMAGERILGKDPKSGRTVLVRLSRYGKPIAQIGAPDELGEDEKPQYANLKANQFIENVTFEEALELFKLPMTLGVFEDKEVIVNDGRYGPYVKWGEAYINIGRSADPMEMTFEKAIDLIKEKKEADKPVTTYKGKPVTRGKGRFGPFLKVDGVYVNIPKKYDPENLSQDEMFELIEAKMEKERNRYISQWPDKKIAVENGRWGPFIRKGRKSYKLPKGKDGKRMTQEEASELSLADVEKIIKDQS